MYEYEKSVDLLKQLQQLRIDIMNEADRSDGTVMLESNLGYAVELIFSLNSVDCDEKDRKSTRLNSSHR